MMLSVAATLALISTLFSTLAPFPLSDEAGGRHEANLAGSEVAIRAWLERREAAHSAGGAQQSVGIAYEFKHVPACAGNDAETEGADVGCPTADAACPGPEVQYWQFRRVVGSPTWELVAVRCLGGDPDGANDVIPGFTLADFQRLPLPAGTPNVEPDNGYTMVGIPTNVYATAEPVTLDTELLGFPVRVRATPSRYVWDFGDGTGHGPTSEPGSPYPALTITHAYERADRYSITLTTYYTGEYSVAGGPWLPIAGEAQVTSAPVDVEALAGRNLLVADPQD